MSNPEPHTQSTTIDQKLAQLSQDVEWFYGDDFTLSQAAAQYQKARQLAQDIEADLNQLKNDIEVIDQDFTQE